MDNDQFKASWEKHKAAFKQEHPHLTDEDVTYEPGKEGDMLERLQAKVGKTKEEIRNWLHIMG